MRAKSSSQSKWAFICGGAVGTLIAFPLAAPVFGGTISDPVATAWGSALGAVAAVAGAYWVAGWQVSQQRRNGAALVHALFYPVATALKKLSNVYGEPSRPEMGEVDEEPHALSLAEWQKVAELAKQVENLHKIFKNRIQRYEPALNLLSARNLHVALDLENELAEIVDGMVRLLTNPPSRYEVETSEVILIEKAPTWSSRFALQNTNILVQSYMQVLEE